MMALKPNGSPSRALVGLVAAAVVAEVAYATLAILSRQFRYGSGQTERPILAVLAVLGLAFGAYLIGLGLAVRCRPGRALCAAVVVPAVLFRATLLPAPPIQEVDIYRYLWDGAVSVEGVSPYRYSPKQVLDEYREQNLPRPRLPEDFRRLMRLLDRSPALATILQRVHHGDLPTVYPVVSQAVFAAATWIASKDSSLVTRLVVMKAVLVGFDLATLGLVFLLLRIAGRSMGWAVAYAWCPLVVKEIAGSGHLDSIAVFLATWAVYLAGKTFFAQAASPARGLAGSALLLALGVGAKLYPIIFAPLLLAGGLARFGIRAVLVPAILFAAVTSLLLVPMWPTPPTPPGAALAAPVSPPILPPPPDSRQAVAAQDPSRGLAAFLRHWEMNDFLFLVVVENVSPTGQTAVSERAWFSVLPESWRERVLGPIAGRVQGDAHRAAFLLARLLTGALFLAVAVVLAWRGWSPHDAERWLRAVFLTAAWFWLLAPTQNPWYWLWALPFLPFARSRLWLLVSGLALVYYLRFWLLYHWPESPVPGFRYRGALLFDFVVTWLEFAPWFAALAAEAYCRRLAPRARCRTDDDDE